MHAALLSDFVCALDYCAGTLQGFEQMLSRWQTKMNVILEEYDEDTPYGLDKARLCLASRRYALMF